jgi:signal transduction histidine kinase
MSIALALNEKKSLSAQAALGLDDCNDLIRQTLQEIRVVSYLLHPPLLDEAGLRSALLWFLDGFSKRSGIETQLTIAEDFGRLPMDMETAIFRIIQESMTNVHRHSQSKTAAVTLSRTAHEIIVEIQDQGVGIPTELAQGVGLRGMRERVRQFRGSLSIAPTHPGTQILVQLPVPPPPPEVVAQP